MTRPEHQTRADSFMESLTNCVVGIGVSYVANLCILPAVFGITVSVGQNLLLGLFYTLVSIARSYTLRRVFNGKTVWRAVRDHDWFGRSHPCDPTPAERRAQSLGRWVDMHAGA